jgi:hypothetical protein
MIGAWKLTEEQVEEIKRLFLTTTLNNTQISKMYDVSRTHISRIRSGHRWNRDSRSFMMKTEIDKEIKNFDRIIRDRKIIIQKKCNWICRIRKFAVSLLN